MQWIKRNLIFVISGAVALVLMGVAIWFLFSNVQEDARIQEELNGQVSEARMLFDAKVSATEENITEAKRQQQQLKEFRQGLSGIFAPAPTFPKTDDQGFKKLLETTIAELKSAATAANVVLPDKFPFTFAAHRNLFQFAPGSIEPWLVQLGDIQGICNVLYKSRINVLDAIQRVPVSPNDTGADFITASILTNQAGTTFTPYVISFRGFSSEVAAVLEGFSRSTNYVIVKSINLVPSTAPLPSSVQSGGLNRINPAYRQPQINMAPEGDRYGIQSAPRPTVPTSMTIRTSGPQAATTILSEHPLQVTMMLEVVRLAQNQ